MSKQQKDTFILRYDFFPQIKMLNREQRGDLLTAIFAYSVDESLPELDVITNMCFGFIKASLDANSERYQATCERNKENGARGGRPTLKPDGLDNNRAVKNKTERLSEKPNTEGGFTEKPSENNGNPIEFDFDSEFDSDLDTDSVSEKTRERERESFLKILLFDKNLLHPLSELDRFEAHYEKTGWVDANGNPIKNKSAALKAWTPDKNVQKLPAATLKIWHEVYESFDDEDRTPILAYFRGFYPDGGVLYITASDKKLAGFLESPKHNAIMREILSKHFKFSNITYRIFKQ